MALYHLQIKPSFKTSFQTEQTLSPEMISSANTYSPESVSKPEFGISYYSFYLHGDVRTLGLSALSDK